MTALEVKFCTSSVERDMTSEAIISRDFQERFFSFSIKSKSSGSCSARGTRPGYGVSVWSEDSTAVANPALMAGYGCEGGKEGLTATASLGMREGG